MEMEGSGEGHVAAVSQWCNDQAARVTQVLIAILELCVGLLYHTVINVLAIEIKKFLKATHQLLFFVSYLYDLSVKEPDVLIHCKKQRSRVKDILRLLNYFVLLGINFIIQ